MQVWEQEIHLGSLKAPWGWAGLQQHYLTSFLEPSDEEGTVCTHFIDRKPRLRKKRST